MQRMIEESLVCHASGQANHPFINGFYLYFVVHQLAAITTRNAKGLTGIQQLIARVPMLGMQAISIESVFNPYFCHEHVEVALHPDSAYASSHGDFTVTPGVRRKASPLVDPHVEENRSWRSDESVDSAGSDVTGVASAFKVTKISLDGLGKSCRNEWVNIRYQGNYYMDRPYELVVKWLVATGSILGEQVQVWARKAGACGFHLIPTPMDPFALPWTPNSDPLRGPIFVALNVSCLFDREMPNLFKDCDVENYEVGMFKLQEDILHRFGFMRYINERETGPNSVGPQYIHVTGAMFVLMSCAYERPEPSAHNQYIRRQSTRVRRNSLQMRQEVGFLWAWNYMLNKKWRTNNTGDEAYMDKMLADFRAFCSGSGGRLRDYWETFRTTLQRPGQTLDVSVRQELTVMRVEDNANNHGTTNPTL
ncbi:PREDICTED: DEP domain-containing protein 5-like [Priapulus caudatus]|uniref:DEP domain-containing protein 5-like n=1 Tax=Priapulus caudatus TaxID=37621 RepID=A0ABM1E4T5_PRICU|nr:PREDICTED: DEP domain-containing protein 5-like [Priapulus caudatus]